MTFYDITRPLTEQMAVWPGDTPIAMARTASISRGDSINLGSISASLHAGTHADAPYHFDDAGETIDQVNLGVFVGPAVVWDVYGIDLITPADLADAPAAYGDRLLLKTGAWIDNARFPEEIPVLDLAAVAWLAAKGIVLLGMDVPSVDPIDSKDLSNHHALKRAGIAILESLDLSGVEPGRYNLAAVPLKIVGADAAPVRAVLWRDS